MAGPNLLDDHINVGTSPRPNLWVRRCRRNWLPLPPRSDGALFALSMDYKSPVTTPGRQGPQGQPP